MLLFVMLLLIAFIFFKRVGETARNPADERTTPIGSATPVDQASPGAPVGGREAGRVAALAAKAEAGSLSRASSRAEYRPVAAAYVAAAAAATAAGLTASADGDILGSLWCSAAFALLRSGDYEMARQLCVAALGCRSALPAEVRDEPRSG